jgi:hypothetical protein
MVAFTKATAKILYKYFKMTMKGKEPIEFGFKS